MERKIIKINHEKCNGCGLCANACHEGAIQMVNGKAELIRDDYCDGLGDCLPVCPTDAISFEVREAAAYDKAAVEANIAKKNQNANTHTCPGIASKEINRIEEGEVANDAISDDATTKESALSIVKSSELRQWPVQIKLAPINAPYYSGANLLIAADCSAYSYANFHEDFIKGKITLIGCPKLDDIDYSEKLTAILKNNDINSVTVVRMEVPCCGGIEYAVENALKASGKMIPSQIVTLSTDGDILVD